MNPKYRLEKDNKAVPVYRQAALKIAEMVKNGTLQPGDKIPPTFELAKDFGIANQTAQNALKVLTDQGILKRIPKKGTFVSENQLSKTLALLCDINLFSDRNVGFNRLFCEAAFNYTQKRGWDMKLYYPHRPDGLEETVSELERDITNGTIRAVLGLADVDGFITNWLKKHCLVPSTSYNEVPGAYTGEFMVYEGLKYLTSSGHSQIGIILQPTQRSRVKAGINKLKKGFSQATPKIVCWEVSKAEPEAGRRLIHRKFSANSQKPDALLILDDTITQGVIFALLEKGIKIPSQLSVSTLSVKGIDIMSPVKLTRWEHDPEKLVELSFSHLFNMLQGKKQSKPQQYYPTLINGKSCGE